MKKKSLRGDNSVNIGPGQATPMNSG